MFDLINKLIYLFLRLFGRIGNYTKPPELDGGAPDELVEKAAPPEAELSPAEAETAGPPAPFNKQAFGNLVPAFLKTAEERRAEMTPWQLTMEIVERPFRSPIPDIPTRRYPLKDAQGKILANGVYSVYGRAPKEEGNKQYPKAQLKVHENLPGHWNKNRPRLYMEYRVGEHFREGLKRAGELEAIISQIKGEHYPVLSYMYSIGSYSFRHIRHNPANQLSYHSWAIAFDQNPGWNRGVTRYPSWQKRVTRNGKKVWVECGAYQAQRGPINKVLPFSKQYYEVFPKSCPVELVMAFKSVHFAWGGDWGRSRWHDVVARFGVRYDQNDPTVANSEIFKAAMKEWAGMTYYDGMHFELIIRREWAAAHYQRMKKKLG